MISVVAWLTACGLLGSLAPNASGAGLAVAAIFILLLTAVGIVALVASVVDTVRLHRRDAGVRRQAMRRTSALPGPRARLQLPAQAPVQLGLRLGR